jgi:hypothetical protein
LLLWSLFLMTCRASSTGTSVKRPTTSKLTKVSKDWISWYYEYK